ncbi:hypothetical protein EAM_0397 [Erwinia amylovora ATCC 49946]|nr:hypothetical protein EAM_0397 [Erwinia amylovora ATCC 49946]
MVHKHQPGGFGVEIGAKFGFDTFAYNVTCFDCEVITSPLFRWPNSACHYKKRNEYFDASSAFSL